MRIPRARRIGPPCLKQVQAPLEVYREEVWATALAPNTKEIYLRHAESFVRRLDGDFESRSGL